MHAKVVINAAGPWVDSVLDLAGAHDRQIGPTKGSHCVVDAFPGAPDTCIFFESPHDARPMFVLPWQGRFMIGTTDLPYDGSLDEITIDADETDYLLSAVNQLIPRAKLTADDVLWSYSGVRPLPYVGELDDPSKVTRDHQIISHDGSDSGLVTIIGGKLTTHRALGEQVADQLQKTLGQRVTRSVTRSADLPGAPDKPLAKYREWFVAQSALPEDVAGRLVDTYGSAASDIAAIVEGDPELARVIDEDSGAIAAEVLYARREEGAHTLEDIVLRRTLIGINKDVGISAAPRVADVLVDAGEWTRAEADEQLERYGEAVRRFAPRVLAAGEAA